MNMLTPKVKENFEEWYLKTHYSNIAFQFGMLQDYFATHKIYILCGYDVDSTGKEHCYYEITEPQTMDDGLWLTVVINAAENFKTMHKARKTAIKEASKLAEEKL